MAAVQVVTSVTSFSNMAKGYMGVTLLDYATSALSVIHEGSVLEVAGTCFRWDAAETPGTWVNCTTAATAYLTCVPSGSAGTQILTSGWTSTAPTWHDVNQGWYASAGSSSRVIASAYKTSNTSQNNKRLLLDPIVDEARPNAIVSGGIITASGGLVAGTGNATLLKKVVSIGEWNMDATASVSVAHGLTTSKIRSISAVIFDDSGTAYPIEYMYGTALLGGYAVADSTNIVLGRSASGVFDSVEFNATAGTVVTRGYVVIEYIP